MKVSGAKLLRLSVPFIVTFALFFVGATLLPASTESQSLRLSSSLPIQGSSITSNYVIVPNEMDLSGDVAVCGDTITDTTVASWCTGVPTGTIMLGVDPNSSDPDDWDGGQATVSLYIGDITFPTVAVLTISWSDRDGKGIHSPQEGRVVTTTWDGVPIWTKRTRDVSTSGDYYAAQHHDVLATAVLTQPFTHTLAFQVPVSTAWHISTIAVDLYSMPRELRGIAYGPFRDCQNPHWGPFPTEEEVKEDIARLFHMSNGIRTYSALTMTGQIPRIAHEHGLPVCAGAWLGREKDAEGNPVLNKNREEISALITIANTVPLDCVIVGNEVLLRGDLTEAELLAYIQEVKDAVDVPVTTAEIGALLRSHPAVLDAVELIMFHIYAYWDKQPIDRAVDYVVQEYLRWREEYPNKRIIIGETGWPSDGPARGEAVPSLENQRRFFYGFLAAAEQHDIEFYYFDAFDELWKREGGVGSHWGYDYADRTGKHEVQNVLISKQHLFHWVYLPLMFKDGLTAAVGDRPPSSRWTWAQPHAFPSVQEAPEDEFVVFGEYCAKENHFAPSGWMGDWNDLGYYECDRSNPHSGQVSVRISYAAQGPESWAGIYWQEPDGNWATIEGAGYDLDDATSLRFYARGERGDEQIKFLMGGIWGEYPDSQQPALSTDIITLTQDWTEYTIDLRGRDLSYVIGGFGFVTDRCLNTEPITFYLDDIHYVLDGDPGAPTPTPTPETPYTFDVYRDADVAGNHYVPSGWMGDTGDIILDECSQEHTHTGRTAIRVEYTAERKGPHECDGLSPCGWAGVYWQEPAYNWGDRPGGYDLTGARALTFWAKGENGGENISFKIGGIGCASASYPDSLCPARVLGSPIILTTTWQVFTIPLSADLDLRSLVGGFLWTASQRDNPDGAIFYLDDIQYHFNIDIVPTFFSSPPIAVGPGGDRTFDLDFGDADNDGDLDLAVGNHAPKNQVCWNNGGGAFACENAFAGGPTFDVDWGDMNNDGDLDIVVSDHGGYGELPTWVCLNNGDRTFTCNIFGACIGGAGSCCHVALADFDKHDDKHDGLDIALGIRWAQNLIYYNDGTGTFSVNTTITDTFCNGWTMDMESGDVDNDDDPDLVVVGNGLDYVCINNGGTFTETRYLDYIPNTWSVALADADRDGDLDIATGYDGPNPSNRVYLNDGHGYFTETLLVGLALEETNELAWGDVDNDGDPDLAVVNWEPPSVLYFNDPVTATNGITFTRKFFFGEFFPYLNSVTFGDVDNDCDLDMAVGNDGGQNVIYLNTLLGGCVYLPIIIKNYPWP
jgi:exo-beta-1,3-glucanase (GH17 family)